MKRKVESLVDLVRHYIARLHRVAHKDRHFGRLAEQLEGDLEEILQDESRSHSKGSSEPESASSPYKQ